MAELKDQSKQVCTRYIFCQHTKNIYIWYIDYNTHYVYIDKMNSSLQ